jgi:histidyl-tRNA synthetase
VLPGLVELRLTAWQPRYSVVVDAVAAALAGLPHVTVTVDPDRERGRDYYTGFAFTAFIDGANVADGGLTDWTQTLVGSRKERLCTTGIGIDRLAALTDARRSAT